jgi:Holliday junction resolvasome RuvABC endonuclease subunit
MWKVESRTPGIAIALDGEGRGYVATAIGNVAAKACYTGTVVVTALHTPPPPRASMAVSQAPKAQVLAWVRRWVDGLPDAEYAAITDAAMVALEHVYVKRL